MTKQPERWPLSKIVAATLGCAAVGTVLLWLSALLGEAEGEPTASPLNRRTGAESLRLPHDAGRGGHGAGCPRGGLVGFSHPGGSDACLEEAGPGGPSIAQ
jgi:hypothetical protein